ncbi:MAG: hypothetical protein ACOX6E_01160 [Syntrophomonadaceae bacterium]
MTIKSIDAQVLVQKISDVAKIQQAQQLGNNHKQDEFINSIYKETEKYSKKVNEALPGYPKKVDKKSKQIKRGNREGKKYFNKSVDSNQNNNNKKIDIIV